MEAGIGPRRPAVVLDASTPDEVGFSAIERTMLRNISACMSVALPT